jgi:hypothetical protein
MNDFLSKNKNPKKKSHYIFIFIYFWLALKFLQFYFIVTRIYELFCLALLLELTVSNNTILIYLDETTYFHPAYCHVNISHTTAKPSNFPSPSILNFICINNEKKNIVIFHQHIVLFYNISIFQISNGL